MGLDDAFAVDVWDKRNLARRNLRPACMSWARIVREVLRSDWGHREQGSHPAGVTPRLRAGDRWLPAAMVATEVDDGLLVPTRAARHWHGGKKELRHSVSTAAEGLFAWTSAIAGPEPYWRRRGDDER